MNSPGYLGSRFGGGVYLLALAQRKQLPKRLGAVPHCLQPCPSLLGLCPAVLRCQARAAAPDLHCPWPGGVQCSSMCARAAGGRHVLAGTCRLAGCLHSSRMHAGSKAWAKAGLLQPCGMPRLMPHGLVTRSCSGSCCSVHHNVY